MPTLIQMSLSVFLEKKKPNVIKILEYNSNDSHINFLWRYSHFSENLFTLILLKSHEKIFSKK